MHMHMHIHMDMDVRVAEETWAMVLVMGPAPFAMMGSLGRSEATATAGVAMLELLAMQGAMLAMLEAALGSSSCSIASLPRCV